MRVGLDGKPECSRKTKVSQLDRLAVVADQQVLWLKVAVENAVRMQEHKGLVNLVEEALCLFGRERRALLLHILLQVVFEIFEDEVQLVLGEQYFLEPMLRQLAVYLLNNVRVPQILQETDFADSGRRDAVVLLFESDLLDGNVLASLQVMRPVDDTVRSFAQFLKLLILIQAGNRLGESPLRALGLGSMLCDLLHY